MTRDPIGPGPVFLQFSSFTHAIYMYIRGLQVLRQRYCVVVYLTEGEFDGHFLRETLEAVISAPGSKSETGRTCLRKRVNSAQLEKLTGA